MSLPAGPTSGSPDPLPAEVRERLQRLMGSNASHIVVIRSADREMGSALLRHIIVERPGPAVIISSPTGSSGDPSTGLPPSRPEVWFKALPVADDVVSVAAATAVMRFILSLMRDDGDEPLVLPQWIPPRLLRAYSVLPVNPTPTIGVDSWVELISKDLRYRPSGPAPGTTPEQRERTALNALDDATGVHFVIVTRRPRLALEAKAELVLEVADRPGNPPGHTTLRVIDATGGSWTVPRPGRDPPLVLGKATVASRCRCGKWIAAGDPMYMVTTRPALAWAMFRGQQFCSPRCVRAFCLESLESLDTFDTPATKEMVSDLHEFSRALTGVFAAILDE